MKRCVLTRRAFLAAMTTTASGVALGQTRVNSARVIPGKHSPNEKLNIASIGVGGQGQSDVFGCRRENIVALCDVDAKQASRAFAYFKKLPKFKDYRKMLEQVKEIDAITVTTPDHTHAPAAYMAMKMGKHVYVQKPLTHTIAETHLLMKTAHETGVATQMGNQGHSLNGVRELCEMLWSDAIGPVREVHAWTFRPKGRWAQGIPKPLPPMDVPKTLAWDLWLGTAAKRPYNSGYCPHVWRGWYDFGDGALGDMACHVLDPAFMALKLNEAPAYSVEIVKQEGRNSCTYPTSEVLKYSFPARANMPPVDLYWYDGGQVPPWPKGIPKGQQLGDGTWGGDSDGSYFVGDKGIATTGTYGMRPRLMPDERMKDYKMPPPTLPRIHPPNHYYNWFDACKGGPPACSNFDYSGPLTIMIQLGCIAMRAGTKIAWDNKTQAITNLKDGAKWLTTSYRKGWELPV